MLGATLLQHILEKAEFGYSKYEIGYSKTLWK